MVVSQRYDFPPEGDDAGSKVIKSGVVCDESLIHGRAKFREGFILPSFPSFCGLVGQMFSDMT